jgi:hypothetical protein
MARALGEQGADALDRKDFVTALDRFARADKLYHAPTLALGLGRALAGNGKLVAALETFQRVAREPLPANSSQAFKDAVARATKEMDALEPRVPSVVIDVAGAKDPVVTMDGETVPVAALGLPRPADPGAHVIRAEAPGYAPASTTVQLSEGAHGSAKLTLVRSSVAPLPPASASASARPISSAAPASPAVEPSRPFPTTAVVVLGIGGVGLATAAITGALFLGKRSELLDDCPADHCPSSEKSTHDSYKTLGLVSTIGLGVGLVGVGVGTALLLSAPQSSDTALRVYVGPLGGGLAGSF